MADDISIDFSDVTDVKIPLGTVKYIEKYEDGIAGPLYWKRPFTYPVFGFCFNSIFITPDGTKVYVYNLPLFLRDGYEVYKLLGGVPPTSTNSDGSLNVYYQEPIIWLPTEDDVVDKNDYSSTFTWIKSGLPYNLRLRFFKTTNESQADVFPTLSSTLSTKLTPINSVFKIYAVPDNASEDWAFGKLIYSDLFQDWDYKLIEHDTDYSINNSSIYWLVGVGKEGNNNYHYIPKNYNSKAVSEITLKYICDDFTVYKNLYEGTKGDIYPKSQYPYLVIVQGVQIYAHTLSNKCVMYFGVKVKR